MTGEIAEEERERRERTPRNRSAQSRESFETKKSFGLSRRSQFSNEKGQLVIQVIQREDQDGFPFQRPKTVGERSASSDGSSRNSSNPSVCCQSLRSSSERENGIFPLRLCDMFDALSSQLE